MYFIELEKKLQEREKDGQPIRVGVAGTGFVGRALINQIQLMKGIRVSAVANRNADKAARVLKETPSPGSFTFCERGEDLKQAVEAGKIGVVENPLHLAAIDLDIVIDCMGDPQLGALLSLSCIDSGKHFIAAPEMDATIGPILQYYAQKKGVVYTGTEGDEPGVIMGLYHYVSLLGLDIVAAGKFKGFYDPRSNPQSIKPWADKFKQNPWRIASFADGSKMNMEMAILANATGLVPDVQGMHCPTTSLEKVPQVLSTRDQGGILERKGVVEVVLEVRPSGGVFVVASTKHPQIKKDLEYLKMGQGPNYLFYRPYHLCGMEIGVSILRAVLSQSATIAPKGAPVAEVIAVAKRDLNVDEELDSIGGYTSYGLLDRSDVVKRLGLLPLGLASECRLIRPIKGGEPIPLDSVIFRDRSLLYELWNLQRRIFHGDDGFKNDG